MIIYREVNQFLKFSEKRYDAPKNLQELITKWEFENLNIIISINGVVLSSSKHFTNYEDLDLVLNDGDVVHITKQARGGAVGMFIIKFVASTLLSWTIGQIFGTKQKSVKTNSQTKTAKDVYNINGETNQMRVGEILPIIYGRVRIYPDLVAQPHYYYKDNKQVMCSLMCIANITPIVQQVLLNDTPSDNLGDDFKWKQIHKYQNTPLDLSTLDDDGEWIELVKDVEEARNTLVAQTPTLRRQPVYMRDNYIRMFNKVGEPTAPELKNLRVGDLIEIAESIEGNNGKYVVSDIERVSDTEVKIYIYGDLNLEPEASWHDINEGYSDIYDYFKAREDGSYICLEDLDTGVTIKAPNLPKDAVFLIDGTNYNDTYFWVTDTSIDDYLVVTPEPTDERQSLDSHDINYQKVRYPVTFFFSNYTTPVTIPLRTKTGREVQYVEIDFNFPNGLYTLDAYGKYTERKVTVAIVLYNVETGANVTKYEDFVWDDPTPYRKTFRYEVPKSLIQNTNENEVLRVKVRKYTHAPETSSQIEMLYIDRIKGLYGFESTDKWTQSTYLWAKLTAGNEIKDQQAFKINAWVYSGKISMLQVIQDLYKNTYYSAGLPIEDVIVDSKIQDLTVDAIITEKKTVMDAIKEVAEGRNCYAYTNFNNLIVEPDDAKTYISYMFNETNILPDSYSETFKFIEDRHDGVKGMYVDFDKGWVQNSVLYPSTAINPNTHYLQGVTNETEAYDIVRKIYDKQNKRRVVCKFKTNVQGYIPKFMDRIAISTTHVNSTIPEEVFRRFDDDENNVTSIYGTIKNIDTMGDLVHGQTVYVTFRNLDGMVTDDGICEGTFKIDNDVTKRWHILFEDDNRPPSWVTERGVDNKEGIKFSISKFKERHYNEWQITKITSDGGDPQIFTIEAVNYIF